MKDTELRLISELMKNSRRSDRELAKVLGISQPTVTRLRTRLEKEGVIKEYTMIPDFSKLGYTIMALTFIEHRKELDPKEKDEIVRMGVERARQEDTTETIMAERGMGLGYDAVVISYQKDYSSHVNHINTLKQFSHMNPSNVQSFLINLEDKVHYRPLTLSTTAKHVLTLKKE